MDSLLLSVEAISAVARFMASLIASASLG